MSNVLAVVDQPITITQTFSSLVTLLKIFYLFFFFFYFPLYIHPGFFLFFSPLIAVTQKYTSMTWYCGLNLGVPFKTLMDFKWRKVPLGAGLGQNPNNKFWQTGSIHYTNITNVYQYFRWKIDRKWTIPNIGKLELLYLENQIYQQQQQQQQRPTSPSSHQQQRKKSYKSNGSHKMFRKFRYYCEELI